MQRKYIDDLNIKFEDTPQGFCNQEFIEAAEGSRAEQWHKEREIYGFDSRETWSLDYNLKLWLYERLCMFNKVNNIDTNSYKFKYKDKELTQQECIDKMIEGLRYDITLGIWDKQRIEGEVAEKIDDVFPILSLCINSLWW